MKLKNSVPPQHYQQGTNIIKCSGGLYDTGKLFGSFSDVCGGICSAGYYAINVSNTLFCHDKPCKTGHYCPVQSSNPTPCAAGTFNPVSDISTPCTNLCPIGFFCPQGTTGATTHPCPAGRYSNQEGAENDQCSGECNEGFYCPPASTSPKILECPSAASYCPIASPLPVSVPKGAYSTGGTQNGTQATYYDDCKAGYRSI